MNCYHNPVLLYEKKLISDINMSNLRRLLEVANSKDHMI